MKKIVALVIVVAIVVAGVVFVPRLVHKCDDCDKIFVGTGYEPNIIGDVLSSDVQIICKDCATKQHALAIAMGQSVDEFRRGLFE